jgi:carboxypeptidase family protein/calcineurin-like phosphoesterase family protein/Big-like domain-containing protein
MSRARPVASVVLLLLLLLTTSGHGALADAPPCSTTTTATYSLQVCLTKPTPDSTVSGGVGVSATAAILSGSLRVVRVVFTVDAGYTLTDYQSPYSFVLPTAHWVDGLHTLSVSAVMSDTTNTSAASESLAFSNGLNVVPPNTNPPTVTTGTAPAPGANLVVAAVGDGAGGDLAATSVVNMITSWSPNLFLYLGDVYEKGSYPEFANWYDGTFGVLRPITNPVIGNHEYGTRRAAGYYDYWNNEPNYYSFDAGGWHFIALNSTSQYQAINWSGELAWLQSDLAAHAGACTVAFWHHPLYNIGPEEATGRVQDFWTPLANARATLVLNGHDHDYQRWQSLDADGNPSTGGLTEIVAGTGGHSGQYIAGSDPRVVASKSAVFGALQLQLSPIVAQFKFFTVSGSTSTLFDSGSIPCRGYGALAGTVNDALTGNPVAGATISYQGASTLTNSSGTYSLLKAPLGSYQLTVDAPGYSSRSQAVTVNPAATTNTVFKVTPMPGTLTGVVSDAGTGLPLAGATVSYSGGQAVTDSAGAYSLGDMAEGTYLVGASASGYAATTQTVTIGPGQAAVQNFVLAQAGVGTVDGKVTDAATGLAVAGVKVSYTGGTTTTDSDGMYHLTSLPDGNTTLTATSAGYTDQTAVVVITAGSTTQQDFALAPLPGSIGGVVTDSVTGRPIAGAQVTYSDGGTRTNAAGAYSLAGVTEGTYAVSVSAAGYVPQVKPVSVGAGADVVQGFALVPVPGAVAGTVVDVATGIPLAGATVSYSGGQTSTDGSGRYSFPTVIEGSYEFTASAAGYSPQAQTVSVGPGATVSLNLSLVKRVFADGFESGSMSAWTTNQGLVVQSTAVHSGSHAAEANSAGAATYARDTFGSTYSGLYLRTYFLVKAPPSSTVNLVGYRTSTGTSLARLYVDSQGRLALRNDVASTSTTGPALSAGSWHSLEFHLIVNGAASTIEVWLDGNPVSALTTQTASLGAALIGQVQLGESQIGRSYDIAFDDLVVQTARVGP